MYSFGDSIVAVVVSMTVVSCMWGSEQSLYRRGSLVRLYHSIKYFSSLISSSKSATIAEYVRSTRLITYQREATQRMLISTTILLTVDSFFVASVVSSMASASWESSFLRKLRRRVTGKLRGQKEVRNAKTYEHKPTTLKSRDRQHKS